MSNKIEGVPKGWELVRIGTPCQGEFFLNHRGHVELCENRLWGLNYVIVRKIEPPKPVYVPWTFETVPIGVHVECLIARKKGIITGAGDDGARIGATEYSFEKLLADWQQHKGNPCGTIANENKTH